MERQQRIDRGTLGKRTTRTSQGFLRVDGNLTRTGVLKYRRADGSVVRELRHPDEVFRADSLESLRVAPITDLHPTTFVDPKNIGALGRGTVAEMPRQDGKFVAGALLITHADLIGGVEDGSRRECSPGYTCRIDATPGVYNGEHYDCIQRDIVYNHLAMGPVGWGRSGSEVSIHLDGGGDLTLVADTAVEVTDGGNDKGKGTTMETEVIKIDGHDYTVQKGAGSHILKALANRDEVVTKQTARADSAESRAVNAEKDRDAQKTRADAAESPASVSKAVESRVKLQERATQILGADAKFDGKSDEEIRIECVKKSDASYDPETTPMGKDPVYVRARFDAIKVEDVRQDMADKTAEALLAARLGAGEKREDADKARQAMIERNRKASTDPLPAKA